MVSLIDLIGKTPLIELKRLPEPGSARVLVKLEYLNPTGSHKDRIALYMIRRAEREGLLKPGGLVVEASSGNTAISVAWVARLLGYQACVVVDERTAPSKIALLKALGAEVIVAPPVDPEHPMFYRKVAARIAKERGGVYLNQFENEANVQAHYETTAREIWEQTGGEIDAFVMGVGTGGTITGVGRFLKEKKPECRVVAAVPRGAALVGGEKGEYIEGLVEHYVPPLLDMSVVDEVREVPAKTAIEYMLKLAKEEGVLGGMSTGAHVAVALEVAKELGAGATVVTVAADSMFRYSHIVLEALSK